MKDAKSLLLAVLAAIPDGKKVASLFADDGAVELPFLHSVGIEPRYGATQQSKGSTISSNNFIPTSRSSPKIRTSSLRLRTKFSPSTPRTRRPQRQGGASTICLPRALLRKAEKSSCLGNH
jgi:hypothetical protein